MPRAPREPLMDLAAVCELLGDTEGHLRRLVYTRQIPYIKVGGRLRFDPRAIDAWLAEQTVGVAS